MQDFFEDLYDDDEGEEPSFSFHDFKKWLSKQRKPKEEKISESLEKTKKEALKEKFKRQFKEKRRKKG